ncbi:MAG: acyclic terpene utilization AtuA family protein [Planctomycetaceae bacterium]
MTRPLRIANCSGFYGDRLAAAREMIEDGPIDFLTGDYLAELTMMILWKAQQKDSSRGYAVTFMKQMEQVLGSALDQGIRIVSNAGGLNPVGLAHELRVLCDRLGLKAKILHVSGDDLLPGLDELQDAGHELRHLDTGITLRDRQVTPLTANAYLGCWGIVEALNQSADVVVCPRVTDASIVAGPAAWHFGWKRDDWNQLAGAIVAGHVIECGTQCTGGNYAFFQEVPGLEHPGFPIAEISEDGSSVITKHEGTGGLVSVDTVTAQLLYEIADPAYMNPDVVSRFDTIRIEQHGPNRVRLSEIRGEPAPADVKVCLNYLGGFRNQMTLVLTGLDIKEKADLVERTLRQEMDVNRFEVFDVSLSNTTVADAAWNQDASALLTVTVKSQDSKLVGRAFSGRIVELALASYPGLFTTTPPTDARSFGVYWPALVPADVPQHAVVLEDGTEIFIPASVGGDRRGEIEIPVSHPVAVPDGPTTRVPLGTIYGARSGDKGGNANVGVWGRTDESYAWLAATLTIDCFRKLIPETSELEIHRFELPNLRSLNFVVVGLLGEGVASSIRFDAQAKSLGEFLRSRLVDLPDALLV